MSFRRMLLVTLAAGLALLAVSVGPRVITTSRALPATGTVPPEGVTIPYPGRLTDAVGQPAVAGVYDLSFALYEAPVGGEALWSEVQEGVEVQDGAFATSLGTVNPILDAVLGGGERWLAVSVRGPGEDTFTALTPRQRLSAAAPTVLASPTNGGACPHDHFGASWQGSGVGLTVLSQDWIGLQGLGIQGMLLPPAPLGRIGVYGYGEDTGVYGDGPTGVRGTSSGGEGVWGSSGTGTGVYGTSTSHVGVYGESITGPVQEPVGAHGVYGVGDGSGVSGRSVHGTGVWGISQDEVGVAGESASFHGVYGETGGNYGWISGVYGKATQSDANGVTGWNEGAGVGVYAYSKNGRALFAKGDTGNLIEAWDGDPNAIKFKVTNAGAAYATGGWQGAPDFAELIEPESDAVAYEPGDVLVISAKSDRAVARSSEPYSTLVAGVYSENPGFVGSPDVMEDRSKDDIPVAVVGIVTCKVSAENGPIRRGDLLVTSSTAGHAMRAESPEPGTILGKALEPLETGTGVILVLVTLQ